MAKDPNAPAPARPLSIDAVADLCYAAGFRGQGLEDALCVAPAESGLDAHNSLVNTAALGARGPSIGSIDRGLFMLNSHWHSEVPDNVAYDPAGAAKEAYRISAGGTNWTPWSVWPSTANRHRTEARAAAKRREAAGGSGSSSGTGLPDASTTSATTTSTGSYSPDIIIPAASLPVGYVVPLGPNGMSLELASTHAVQRLDELILGGEVDLSTDQASQITVQLHAGDNGLDAAVVGSKFAWSGTFGIHSKLRLAAWEERPGTGATEVLATIRSDGVHWLKDPQPNPEKSRAPSRQDVSPTEYAAELAKMAQLRFHGQGSARLTSIAPSSFDAPGAAGKRLETPWEVLVRYADDLGYLLFEVDGVLCFGSIEWLTAQATELRVGWNRGWGNTDLDAVDRPGFRFSEDNPLREQTISFALPRYRGELVRPGMRVAFRGITNLQREEGWFVTHVNWPVDAGHADVQVEAILPVNAKTSPGAANEAVARGGAPSGEPGSLNALDFVNFALSQAGDPFHFGAEAQPNDQDPDAFDCSELVQWAAARAGVAITDGTWLQYRAINKAELYMHPDDAIRLRGALLFHFSSNPLVGGRPSSAHVAISLGDGRTIEARSRKDGVVIGNAAGRSWTHAGQVPGLDYGWARALVGDAA